MRNSWVEICDFSYLIPRDAACSLRRHGATEDLSRTRRRVFVAIVIQYSCKYSVCVSKAMRVYFTIVAIGFGHRLLFEHFHRA